MSRWASLRLNSFACSHNLILFKSSFAVNLGEKTEWDQSSSTIENLFLKFSLGWRENEGKTNKQTKSSLLHYTEKLCTTSLFYTSLSMQRKICIKLFAKISFDKDKFPSKVETHLGYFLRKKEAALGNWKFCHAMNIEWYEIILQSWYSSHRGHP